MNYETSLMYMLQSVVIMKCLFVLLTLNFAFLLVLPCMRTRIACSFVDVLSPLTVDTVLSLR